MHKIGTANAQFAQIFLERESIPLIHSNLGLTSARRVDFLPVEGRVRCRVITEQFEIPQPAPRRLAGSGDVELF
jgi:chemotaxis protein CheD